MAFTLPTPTVTEAGLKARLGGGASLTTDEVNRLLALSTDLAMEAFKDAWKAPTVEVMDEVICRIARALKDSTKTASTGASQVTAGEVQPLRAPADPLVSAYPLIRRYVVLGL